MIDNTQIKFLRLFKNSVKSEFKEKIKIESYEECASLMNLSIQHHISPMIYEAINSVEGFQENAKEIQNVWKRNATISIISQTQRTQHFLEIYDKLLAEGITPLIFKGIICRNLYRKPDARCSNDEDFLIPLKDFEKCDRVLLENGFEREADIDINHPDYEVTYRHISGVRIEVHTSLLPKDNHAFSMLNNEFANVFEKKKTVQVEGINVYTLDDTEHFFFLICHSFKHFAVSGFGIRQLYDMLIMAEKWGNNIDWNYIVERAKFYHMYVFLLNLLNIGEIYLGFDRDKSGCPEFTDINPDSQNLLEDILDGGSYGKSSMGRVHSANITLSALNTERNGKPTGNLSLISSLFPSKKYMQKEYRYVKKCRLLLPVAWGQRICKYLKKKKRMKQLGMKKIDSIEIGKQRIELLRQYGIVK